MIQSKIKVGPYVITQLFSISCKCLKSIRIIMFSLPILYLFVTMIGGNRVVAYTNQTCNQVAQLYLDRRVTNPLLLGSDILGLRGPSVTRLINLSPLYLVDRLFLGARRPILRPYPRHYTHTILLLKYFRFIYATNRKK